MTLLYSPASLSSSSDSSSSGASWNQRGGKALCPEEPSHSISSSPSWWSS
jgi:hypothetical protein